MSRALLRAALALASLSAGARAQEPAAPTAAGRSASVYVAAFDRQDKLVATLGRDDVRVLDEGVAVAPTE